MSTPADASAAWARETHGRVSEWMVAQGRALVGWAVIGNAGALAIALSAVLSGTACDQALVKSAIAAFAWGLGLAVSASIISYAGGMFALSLHGDLANLAAAFATNKFYLADLEARGLAVPANSALQRGIDEMPAKLDAVRRQLRWMAVVAGAATLLILASFVAFGVGMAGPVNASPRAFGTCSGNAAATFAAAWSARAPIQVS